MTLAAQNETPTPSTPSAEGLNIQASPTIAPENTTPRATTSSAPHEEKPKPKRLLRGHARGHTYGSKRLEAKEAERLLPCKPGRGDGRPMSFDDATILTICEGLRLGLSRRAAAQRTSVPNSTLFSWMTLEGEPYATIRQLIHKAEADFQFRHAANLTLASRETPQISEWLLSHARSSRADWRQYQQALIDAQG